MNRYKIQISDDNSLIAAEIPLLTGFFCYSDSAPKS